MWDDCLSFPDLLVRVERHNSISISFINKDGSAEEWENLPQDVSELLQHEIDHLHGVLALSRKADPVGYPDIPSGIVQRDLWENNKQKYAAVVDYFTAL